MSRTECSRVAPLDTPVNFFFLISKKVGWGRRRNYEIWNSIEYRPLEKVEGGRIYQI